MKLRCAIVDDEPLALGLLESYVKKTPLLELNGAYSSAIQAMKNLPENPVNLIFLDIQMPELNGLEFSRMIPQDTRIIFTTAFEQYALDGYKVNALDYLLKPVSYSDFMQAVNKAVKWFELQQKAEENSNNFIQASSESNYIYIKSDYKLIQINLDKILYIEGLKDYIKIHLEDEPRPILSLVSMRAMEEKLPSSRFLRVHRSFIVQKQKIKVIDKGRIVFGKEYIPISDSYKQELQNYVNEHIV
ncbi:LytTR family DNA-binding domain-containing protein [Bacteroides ilei]|jgi:two-component system LytT family response regulator|uniref:LytR/AlgR family response regulator transcription factor n=1 Tax=Bacteroides ilei TaxID=1907658 RepID=UPI0009316A85|nr:LytTR family DNA-binding domain-containing protein [Bacteroides ilei]